MEDLFIKGRNLIVEPLNKKTLKFDNPLFLEGSKYFPLKSLIGKETIRLVLSKRVIDDKDKKIIDVLCSAKSGVFKVLQEYLLGGRYTRHNISRILNFIRQGIDTYIGCSPETTYDFRTDRYSRTSYDRIASSFFSGYFTVHYLQSLKVIASGLGTILRGCEKQIIMSVVFRADLFKYHKLYFIENGTFDYKNMEFWINYDVDTPQYPFKGFRKMYRNQIKPRLQEAGMPIIEKGDVDALLRSSFTIPQESIVDLIQWKINLVAEFLETERKEMEFEF